MDTDHEGTPEQGDEIEEINLDDDAIEEIDLDEEIEEIDLDAELGEAPRDDEPEEFDLGDDDDDDLESALDDVLAMDDE